MQIFVSGSLAYDRIMDFPGRFSDHLLPDKLHIINVCFMVDGLQERFGGTAGNIAYSLGLLGETPTILGTGGIDFDRYRNWLTNQGLPLHGVKTINDVMTASAYITTDKADNQITAFNPGAMGYPSLFDFEGVDPKDTLAIISPGSLDDMRTYSRVYREKGIRFIFDPGQSIPAFSGGDLAEMINGSDILIVNDYELEMVIKSTGLDKEALLGRTGSIITTLGEKGSRISHDGREVDIPPAKVNEVVDPTGAGDAYRAGLIKGLVMGRDLEQAARMGSVTAAWSVEHLGTQEHRYTEEEFWERYRANFG